MRKAVSFLLLLTVLLSSLAACGESESETNTDASVNSGAPQAADSPVQEAEAETESPTQHWDAVPKTDFGGMDIIATTNNFDSNFYNVLDWEEISGDNLKDAMYNRNRAVESALNCTLESSLKAENPGRVYLLESRSETKDRRQKQPGEKRRTEQTESNIS